MTSRTLDNAPAPGTPAWRATVSASKVPAILGISRWNSQYAVWHEMAGMLEPEAPSEALASRFLWGHIIEESLCQWWKAHNEGWSLNVRGSDTAEITYTNDELGFPNLATLDRRARRGRRFHIVECKLAADLDSWGRPGEPDSVPADYFAQVQFQMGVSGIHTASVVVLGPFGQPEIHDIEFDADLFAGICKRVEAFVKSIQDGVPPNLDNSVATYEAVRGLHPEIHADETVQIDAEDAIELLDAVRGLDAAKDIERAAKMRAAVLMGNAKYLKCGDVKIADRRSIRGGKPTPFFNKKARIDD